jgi:PBP1b-binding outer membrane lipoprotein LpoB
MKNKSMIVLAVILAVGCNKEEEAVSKESYAEYREKNPHTVSSITEKVRKTAYKMEDSKIVEIQLDDLSFGEAFNIERRAKGEGQTFWWHGNEYTTDMRKEDE